MTTCKHSVWKIFGAAVALVLTLPPLARGEFGVCPPYSKTFGPDAPPEEILAFIDEINTRPGGGTVVFEPGSYEGLVNEVSITGVVCLRSTGVGSETPLLWTSRPGGYPDAVVLRVEPGAILTTHSVSFAGRPLNLYVAAGAMFFASDGLSGFRLVNHGAAFLDSLSLREGGVENHGMLRMTGGSIFDVDMYSLNDGTGFINKPGAFALLERVSVHDNEWSDDYTARGKGIHNEGVITVLDSMITSNAATEQECWAVYDCSCGATGISNSGVAYVLGSTIADNKPEDHIGRNTCGTGIRNSGHIEVTGSIVAENVIYRDINITDDPGAECRGPVTDLGYNVFGDDTCLIAEPTSIEADPEFLPDSVELGPDSPAIDRIPTGLCSEIDMLGRARTDGNGDGIVACDSGALEYGYSSVEVVVRAPPYWRYVGRVDLTRTNALFIAVMSGGPIDPTTILFDSIVVGDFPRGPMRGVGYGDKNGDGLPDYNFWYRLDRALVLECRDYDEPFTATTDGGQQVSGRLRFEVVGCAP